MRLLKLKNMTDNDKIVFKNTIGAFIVKGASLIITFFTTPAFIKYFDDNAVLGIWYTLLSILNWFLTFDLGIANGIRNNLVKSIAENDDVASKQIISSGIFSNLLVTTVLSIIGVSLISLIDLNEVFNISETIIPYNILLKSALIIFFGIMCKLLLTIVNAVFYSIQKSAINNFISLIISLMQLLFVLIFKFNDPKIALINLSYAYVIISNLPVLIAGIIAFATVLKKCKPNFRFIKREYISKIMKIGGIFFLCQILYMLIANTNEMFVTNLFGPQYTTEYHIYYKLMSLIYVFFSLALTPIWSIVTKAQSEKNYKWVKNLFKKLNLFAVLAIILQFVLVVFLQFIINIWLNEDAIIVNYKTAIFFALFGSVFVYTSVVSTMACGFAKMKLQVILYSVAAVTKFVIIILLKNIFNDWNVVVLSNAIVLIPYCIFEHFSIKKYLNKQIELNETLEQINSKNSLT